MSTSLDPSVLMDQMKEQAWATNSTRPNTLFPSPKTNGVETKTEKDNVYLQDLSDCKLPPIILTIYYYNDIPLGMCRLLEKDWPLSKETKESMNASITRLCHNIT